MNIYKYITYLSLILGIFPFPAYAAHDTCHELTGFIPFDSAHPSIVTRSTLTSLSEVTSAGGIAQGTHSLFDSDNGFNPNFSGGILFQTLSGYESLSDQGQFSIEVETAFISIGPGSNFRFTTFQTGGIDHIQHADTIISLSNDSGSSSGLFYVLGSTDTFFTRLGNEITPLAITALGKDRFSRLSVSWDVNQYVVAIDHRIVLQHSRNGATLPEIFKNIYLGSDNGGSPIGDTWLKNFVLSSCPAVFPLNTELESIALFGDSLINRGFLGYSLDSDLDPVKHEGFDSTLAFSIKGFFAKKGNGVNLGNHGHSGYAVSDSYSFSLEGVVRDQMLATNPKYVFFQAGSNDVAQNTSDFEVDLKDHLTTIIAHPSIEKIIVSNIPSLAGDAHFNTTENTNQIEEYNLIIAGLEDWWNNAHPDDIGRIVLVDLFNELGGASPLDDIFNGQVSGEYNNLHLSAKGQSIMGSLFAQTLADLIDQVNSPQVTIAQDQPEVVGDAGGGGGCSISSLEHDHNKYDYSWLIYAIFLLFIKLRQVFTRRKLDRDMPMR
ncbi:MAG: hypothetical protein KAS48_06855 [Gammaproteobacteria bacterium]|nr:hypothetical protein [Gammaproteobacteria bacterium]